MRTLLLFFLAFSGILSAQEQSVAIRAMSLSGRGFPETFLPVKGGFEELRFSAIQPSARFRALAQNPMPIFFSIPEIKEGEKIKPDALVKMPTGNKGVLLLGWEADGTRRFVALPDNLGAGSGPGNWLIVNATAENVAFQLGKGTKPTLVKPGSTNTHRVSVKLGEGAAVTAARIQGKDSEVVFSTYWEVYDKQRCIVLFVPEGDGISVRQIADFTAVTAKPEE